jgi:hypothetical protein
VRSRSDDANDPHASGVARAQGTDSDDQDKSQNGLAIAGVVIDDRGHPLPGVQVFLTPVSVRTAARPDTRLSDSIGMFRFEPLEPGEYRISIPADEQYLASFALSRAGVEMLELLRQRIRDVLVSGIVSDRRGQPIPAVEVTAFGVADTVLTDSGGAFVLMTRFGAGGQAPVLAFEHEDYRPLRHQVAAQSIADDDSAQVSVQLDWLGRTVSLSGRVFDSQSAPANSRIVQLNSTQHAAYQDVRTDPQGSYRFENVEVGQGYRVTVNATAAELGFRSESFAIDSHMVLPDIFLDPAESGTLAGHMVDPEGRPLPGFTLWLRPGSLSAAEMRPVRSDAVGFFRADNVPAGVVRLETTSQPLLQVSGISVEPGIERSLSVPLDWGTHWLSGQIVDEQGKGVPGARLVLQWIEQKSELRSSSRREIGSDVAGNFVFSNLGADEHVLTVEAPGFASIQRQYTPGQDSGNVEIVLRAVTPTEAP